MGFPRRIVRGLAGLRLGVGNTARNNVFGADDLPIPVVVTAWHDSELHIPCARHGPPLGVRGDQTLLRAAAGRTEMRLPPSRYPLHLAFSVVGRSAHRLGGYFGTATRRGFMRWPLPELLRFCRTGAGDQLPSDSGNASAGSPAV